MQMIPQMQIHTVRRRAQRNVLTFCLCTIASVGSNSLNIASVLRLAISTLRPNKSPILAQKCQDGTRWVKKEKMAIGGRLLSQFNGVNSIRLVPILKHTCLLL